MVVPLLLALMAAPVGEASALAKERPVSRAGANDDLFAHHRVLSLKIQIPSGSLEPLRKQPRVYVKGTVREGDTIYPEVGVRLKGNAVLEGQEKKPSLVLKFNEFASSLAFHGQTKIFLDNAHQDPSFLSEAIGSEVFRAAGVPVPRVNFARVEFNGRDLGLYVIEQAVNQDFLAEFYSNPKGNLYEGSHTDVMDDLAQAAGNFDDNRSDLKKLAAVCAEADPNHRLEKIGSLLDLDRFISLIAVEVLVWHHNGYALGRSNYRIYHDPGSDRMVFIPHGLEALFNKPAGALLPEWKGTVARAVLETPEGQRRYRERLTALLQGPCKLHTLQARLNDLASFIGPVAAHDPAEAKKFETAVALLHERITQRIEFLAAELRKPGR